MDHELRSRLTVFENDFLNCKDRIVCLDGHRHVDLSSRVGSADEECECCRVVRLDLQVAQALLSREVYAIAVVAVKLARRVKLFLCA